METCVRGFSFMTDVKFDTSAVPSDLQFIEGSELERTWRASRRQRVKQREQKIWHEFVKEQDVVNELIQEDPYQFLEQLPEELLKEEFEKEFKKFKDEESPSPEHGHHQEHDEEYDTRPTMSSMECDANNGMFHIFDVDNDDEDDDVDEDDESDAEGVLDETIDSPCTVRERETAAAAPVSRHVDKPDTQQTENVTSLIENSIYCAKVKDVRNKLAEELLAINTTMINKIFLDVEKSDLTRMRRKAAEFAARYSRVHLYPLQRQMQESSRYVCGGGGGGAAAAGARHTLRRARLLRLAALHHSLLHAAQGIHKSFEQTSLYKESGEALMNLVKLVREAAALCRALDDISDMPPCHLDDDEVVPSCDKVEETYKEYTTRLSEVFESFENDMGKKDKQRTWISIYHDSGSAKASHRGAQKKKQQANLPKSEAEARLSMYARAVPATRRPAAPHPRSSRSQSRRTEKSDRSQKQSPSPVKTPKKKKRGPPLMRAGGGSGGARRPRAAPDCELHTLVETVHFDCKITPRLPDGIKSARAPRSPAASPARPRTAHKSPKESPNKRRQKSPDAKKKSPERIAAETAIEEKKRNVKVLNLKYEDISRELDIMSQMNRASNRERRLSSEVDSPRDVDVSQIIHNLCSGDTPGGTSRSPRKSRSPLVGGALAPRSARRPPESGREPRYGGRSPRQLKRHGSQSPRKDRSPDASTTKDLQPSTPQLLKYLEETIEQKSLKPTCPPAQRKSLSPRQVDRLRLTLDVPQRTADHLFQYRTQYVQHMLASHMYANCIIEKPWEAIGSLSEQIIDSLLSKCAKEMEIVDVINEMYDVESR